MKTRTGGWVTALCSVWLLAAAGAEPLLPGTLFRDLHLKMSLGYGNLSPDAANAVVRGGEQWLADLAAGTGTAAVGAVNDAGGAWDLHAELLAPLTDHVTLGLSAGMTGATESGGIAWNEPDAFSLRYAPEIRFTLIPIRLSGYYDFVASPALGVYLTAGLGFYPGRLNLRQNTHLRFADSGVTEMVADGQATGFALGFHAGAGARLRLRKNLDLFVEIRGQSVRISSLRGDLYVYDSSRNISGEYSGTFWIVDRNLAPETAYPVVVAADTAPDDPDNRNARKLDLDASGWFLCAGIIIRL